MGLLQNFGLTFSKHIRENMRSLLLKIAGLFAVLCIIALWVGYVNNTGSLGSSVSDRAHSNEQALFSIMFLFTTMACASGAMSAMSTKEERLSLLMLPSTPMAKFLTVWIINVPLVTIVFLVFAKMADFLRYFYSSLAGEGGAFVEPLTIDSHTMNVFLMFVIVGQSLFMLGSTIWSKRAFVKTVLALWIIGLVYAILVHFGLELAKINGPYFISDSVIGEPKMWMFWVASVVISLGIYVLSYFRFRESEIVNRW